MRLNLVLGRPAHLLPGYLSVGPFVEEQPGRSVRGDVFDLAAVADPGECEEIVALRALDYVSRGMAGRAVAGWAGYLARGGLLTVSAPDLSDVARALVEGRLSVDGAEALLYGPQRADWEYVKSAHTAASLGRHLEAAGLVVERQEWSEHRAVLTARRP